MSRVYREYQPDQQFLLPPNVRDWLPDDHLALFVSDVVDELDLSAVTSVYESGDGRGMPPWHPRMMVKLLIYAYCMGKPSSRKIELATVEEVPYRVLAANSRPDHDSIAHFRKRHLAALAGLFVQVLAMARQMGLVKLGHVALDGTKVKANASKHKAMSYGRMAEVEPRLAQEVETLLEAAKQADQTEDSKYGKGKRGDELPDEIRRKETRLKKIREAKAALEEEAKAQATATATEVQAKLDKRDASAVATGKQVAGKAPQAPDPEQAKPEDKAQRNFTDPDSRIMLDGASKGFEQCYNAQAAVDSAHQIIVAADITQQGNDKRQLVPMLGKVKENMGQLPEHVSADAGYYSEAAVTSPSLAGCELYVPPDRQRRGKPLPDPQGDQANMSTADKMRCKLASESGRAVYKQRKAIVEPVFGQTKQARGLRRFSFRGLQNVTLEWLLICATHNLLKLFRSGRPLAKLAAA